MGTSKDFEMSPFEAARKLLSMEAQHLSLGTQSDLVFQDMDLVPLLIQENYLNHRPVVATNDQMRMQVSVCLHHMQSHMFGLHPWAAQYNSWRLIKSTPKCVVFSSLCCLSRLACTVCLPCGYESGMTLTARPDCHVPVKAA